MRVPIPLPVRKRVFAEKGSNCFYCSCTLTDKGKTKKTIDHLVHVYRGGTNDYDNLVPSCRYCNLARGPMDKEEFSEWREKKATLSRVDFRKWRQSKYTPQ